MAKAATPSATAKPLPPKPMSLAEYRKVRPPIHDYNKEHKQKLTPLQRLALKITTRVGTMGFFFIILTWTSGWLAWNFLAPKAMQFDPPMAFVLYLFMSNVIQILLMPLIMVGQNVQGAQSDARAAHDLEINVKAEKEIEVILSHLEYQNSILVQLMEARDAKDAAKKP